MHRSSRDPDQSQVSHQMMAASSRPPARRLNSSGWSRLRPAQVDALEVYGLPSKGEARLHDFKTQEGYYKKIVERYMRFCASSGDGQQLEEAFASLSLREKALSSSQGNGKSDGTAAAGSNGQDAAGLSQEAQTRELGLMVMAMRKLREAIVASHRIDDFAQRVYIFITHATILTKHWESYQPALLYLLHKIHPKTPLSQPELQELVGYWVLDLACRQNDLGEAFRIRHRFRLNDRRVDRVLKALIHDDWVVFWRVRKLVDGYQRSLMGWVEEIVRLQALKCLGRTYMSADRPFVERAADAKWEDLVKSGVGWELGENQVVTIRRVKAK